MRGRSQHTGPCGEAPGPVRRQKGGKGRRRAQLLLGFPQERQDRARIGWYEWFQWLLGQKLSGTWPWGDLGEGQYCLGCESDKGSNWR